MMKYDDFALPNLEMIEGMAKEYAKVEKEGKNKELNKEDFIALQQIYDDVYACYNIITRLYAIYPKNRKFYVLSEKISKMKNEFESEFVDYELQINNEKLTISESTVVFDLIKIFARLIKSFLSEVSRVELGKKFVFEILEIISEIIKY